eukprot:6950084-Alexandrium_andersonii.AAC.1
MMGVAVLAAPGSSRACGRCRCPGPRCPWTCCSRGLGARLAVASSRGAVQVRGRRSPRAAPSEQRP